jgi:hypothetical protein
MDRRLVRRGLLFLILSLTFWGPVAGGAEPLAAPDAYADVLPNLRGEVRTETSAAMSGYEIEATLDPTAGTIGGTVRVHFINRATATLREVYFRLFPNASYYGDGGLTVSAAYVDGAAVSPTLEVEETALRVPLPTPLAPRGAVAIDLTFLTTVPRDSTGSYGIFNHDAADGTWVLADWHPILAVYEDDSGWRIDPPTAFGDPTYSDSALYDVTLTAPADVTVVASGVSAGDERRGASAVHHFVAGPAREFTLVADDDYTAASAAVNGTTITVYTEPGEATAGKAALDVAVRALGLFGRRFGAYPFAELDLVQTHLDGALAVSWSGLVFLDGPGLLGGYLTSDPAGFKTVVAHEISHLWWGGGVGSNSNDHTFLNEGLATVSAMIYQEETASADVAASQLNAWVIRQARALLASGDTVVDQPLRDDQDAVTQSEAFYAKAALGFFAIRQKIGAEAFDAGLQDYAEAYQFRIAGPDDLRASFEKASGQNLDDLWRHWFDSAALTSREIDAEAAG